MKILVETIDKIDIYFEALEEYSQINDNWSDNEDLRNDTIKSLNNGSAVLFCARISASKGIINFTGEEYLGMCIYENEEDFYIKYKNDYYTNMRNTVLERAKKELVELIKELQN